MATGLPRRRESEVVAGIGRDLLAALPAELCSECFALLGLKDCISVSHVSRAWRSAALTDHRLWARYRLPWTKCGVQAAAEALATLLARSHPLPFHFTACSPNGLHVPGAVYDIAFANLDRMINLVLDYIAQVSRLLQLHAPLLRRLVCNFAGKDAIYEFPPQWGALKAPLLEDLTVWGLALPPDCQPFPALRNLSANLPGNGRVSAVSFAHVFPNLTCLNIVGVNSAALRMLTPLPPALEVVTLATNSAQSDAIDYSRVLLGVRTPCRIRILHLECASGFLDVLRLFVRTYDGPWRLDLGDRHVILHADAPEVNNALTSVEWSAEVCSEAPLRLEREKGGATLAYLQQLAELRLSLPAFAALHCFHGAWKRELPRLRTLVLDALYADSRDAGDPLPAAAIELPALDMVELCCPCHSGGLPHPARQQLPALLARRARDPIATIRVRSYRLREVSHEDVALLLQLAERVQVETKAVSGDGEIVFTRSSTAGASG